MLKPTVAFLLAILLPGAALADMTATYVAPGAAFTITIEIADNGDVRGDVGKPGTFFLTRGGQGYMVQPGAAGPVVMRVEDMATVMAEQMDRLDPQFREQMRHDAPVLNLVAKGSATVQGRTGTAYVMQNEGGAVSSRPVVVMSSDPALAPLGQAMARQFDMSTMMMARTMGTALFGQMRDILKTGTPLLFSGAELRSVTFAPVAASRFDLPVQPATLDSVRKAMTPAVKFEP